MTSSVQRPLRLLCVHPGASWSTHDVFVGLTGALIRLGVETLPYRLDARIERAGGWLRWCYDRAREMGQDVPEPTTADTLFQAAGEIVLHAAFREVDGVLLVSGMYVPRQVLVALRRLGVPVGLVLTESPYDHEHEVRWAAEADVVWTNERTSVAPLQAACARTHYLPAAYDPVIHTAEPQPGDELVPAHDVVFVGTGFPERIALLEAVDWTGIDLGLYGNWDALTDDSPLRPHLRGGVVDNRVAAALYRRATIGLNLYRTSIGFEGQGHIEHAESLNPRAYELAACECFQIASPRAEADDLGRFGIATPTMRDAGELEATVRDYLSHPALRAVAVDWAHDAVRLHTFAARAQQMLDELAPVLETAPRR